jgi:ATP-dependent Lon protease
LVASRNPDLEVPGPKDLYEIGTVAMVHRLFRAPDGTIRLVVQGIARFRVGEFQQLEPYLKAEIHLIPEVAEEGPEMEALARNVRDQFEHIAEMIPSIPRELVSSVLSLEDPLQTVYTVANFQRMDLVDAQGILELESVSEKLHKLIGILAREVEVLEIGQKIQNEARSEIEKVQREYFLREQLKAIERELGEGDEQAVELEEFRKKIEAAGMQPEAEKQARRELDRLSRLPTAAAEYGVIRTYLDWLVSLPWSTVTDDNLDIGHARQVLDQDHYGLEDVKERILEFLAVRKLRQERSGEEPEGPADEIRRVREGVILCFVGPPGVGKTSLGRSIARAMGRKFIRISLGGMRDEAEIRGHRRTYIGAMPGASQVLRGSRPATRSSYRRWPHAHLRFPRRPGLGPAGGARPRAERRIPRPLPGGGFRPIAGDVHHHRQLAGDDPRPAARPDGDHRDFRIYRGGEGGHRRGLFDPTPAQGERAAPGGGDLRTVRPEEDHPLLYSRGWGAQPGARNRFGLP